MDKLPALVTDLDWCLAIAIAAFLRRLDVGDRAMRLDHPGEVQHQAVGFAGIGPHSPNGHL
jgi:hypothetical protein